MRLKSTEASPTLAVYRKAVLAILTIGLVGTALELLLLAHTEGVLQLLPLALIGVSLPALVLAALQANAVSIRLFQGVMVLFVACGVAGVYLHYRANLGYEQESNPGAAAKELYRVALMGATPALAPGTMVQLGLLGFLFAFRHPGLRSSAEDVKST
jgi:hypothetical protein